MSLLLAIAGIALIGLTLLDAFWTTLSLHGSAPVSGRVARGLWVLNLRVPSPVQKWISPAVGTLIVLAVMLTWIVMLWGGWWLLFSADPSSVAEGGPIPILAGHLDRAYFVGFSIFTLGVGDFVATTRFWRMAAVVSSASGLVLVTLSITYLVPVLSAVMKKRQTAGIVHSLGRTPSEIIIHAWDGEQFSLLPQMLQNLREDVEQISQQHLAYPVLHYFHTSSQRDEFALALASLDDGLQMLASGVAETVRPHPSSYQPLRESIGNLLDILNRDFVHPADEAPPSPVLTSLKEAGIPVVGQPEFEQSVTSESCSRRRRQLAGFVRDAGWDWSHVTNLDMSSDEEA